jgi:hypothetical protein
MQDRSIGRISDGRGRRQRFLSYLLRDAARLCGVAHATIIRKAPVLQGTNEGPLLSGSEYQTLLFYLVQIVFLVLELS